MGKYDDILHLPRPVSKKHAPMSMHDRAAQFSPFAALSGYEEAVSETARLTERKIELNEEEQRLLSEKLSCLSNLPSPTASVTYFIKDAHKEGGAYRTETGVIKKIKAYEQRVCFENGLEISFHDILSVESDVFSLL